MSQLNPDSQASASVFLRAAQETAFEQANNTDWLATHLVLKFGTVKTLDLLQAVQGDDQASLAVAKGVNAIHRREGVQKYVSLYDVQLATRALKGKVLELDPEKKEPGSAAQ